MNDLREREAQLYFQHPDENPELIGVLPRAVQFSILSPEGNRFS